LTKTPAIRGKFGNISSNKNRGSSIVGATVIDGIKTMILSIIDAVKKFFTD